MASSRRIAMAIIAGHEFNKNTVVGVSVGSIVAAIVFIWTISGIGRPLFAADLERIEEKIDSYQTSTAIQILNFRRASLQSELRDAKRDLRRNPDDEDAVEDIDEIETAIKDCDARIACYRSKACKVEPEL